MIARPNNGLPQRSHERLESQPARIIRSRRAGNTFFSFIRATGSSLILP
jgi:hypothetical protein